MQVGVLVPRSRAEVVGDPACLGDAKGLHRIEDEAAFDVLRADRCHFGSDAHALHDPRTEIVDALEAFAPRNHQLTARKQGFQPAFFILPTPPAGCRPPRCLEIRCLGRAMLADARKHRVHAGALPFLRAGGVLACPVVVARSGRLVGAMQGKCPTRRETGLMRPAFEDFAAFECFIKPAGRVAAQP